MRIALIDFFSTTSDDKDDDEDDDNISLLSMKNYSTGSSTNRIKGASSLNDSTEKKSKSKSKNRKHKYLNSTHDLKSSPVTKNNDETIINLNTKVNVLTSSPSPYSSLHFVNGLDSSCASSNNASVAIDFETIATTTDEIIIQDEGEELNTVEESRVESALDGAEFVNEEWLPITKNFVLKEKLTLPYPEGQDTFSNQSCPLDACYLAKRSCSCCEGDIFDCPCIFHIEDMTMESNVSINCQECKVLSENAKDLVAANEFVPTLSETAIVVVPIAIDGRDNIPNTPKMDWTNIRVEETKTDATTSDFESTTFGSERSIRDDSHETPKAFAKQRSNSDPTIEQLDHFLPAGIISSSNSCNSNNSAKAERTEEVEDDDKMLVENVSDFVGKDIEGSPVCDTNADWDKVLRDCLVPCIDEQDTCFHNLSALRYKASEGTCILEGMEWLPTRESPADVDIQDKHCYTDLIYAVYRNDPAKVRVLLDHMADRSLIDNYDDATLLFVQTRIEDPAVVEPLENCYPGSNSNNSSDYDNNINNDNDHDLNLSPVNRSDVVFNKLPNARRKYYSFKYMYYSLQLDEEKSKRKADKERLKDLKKKVKAFEEQFPDVKIATSLEKVKEELLNDLIISRNKFLDENDDASFEASQELIDEIEALSYMRLKVVVSKVEKSNGASVIMDGFYLDDGSEISVKVKLYKEDCKVFLDNEYSHLKHLQRHALDNNGRSYFVRCYDKCSLADFIFVDEKKNVVDIHMSNDGRLSSLEQFKYALVLAPGIKTFDAFVEEGRRTIKEKGIFFGFAHYLSGELVSIVKSAHQAGIVLMDFNGSNVMMFGTVSVDKFQAIDLDSSLRVNTELRQPIYKDLTVTKDYLAPELSKGSWDSLVATPSMDIWSLGIMLLELFKGPELRTLHGIKSLDQLVFYDQKDLDDPHVGLINRVFTDHKFVKDAILGCLQIDPLKRKTATEIYNLLTCIRVPSRASINRQVIENVHNYKKINDKLEILLYKTVDMYRNFGKLIDAVNLSNSSYEDSRLAMNSFADRTDEMIKRFDNDRKILPDFDFLLKGMTHEVGRQFKSEIKGVYEVMNSSQEKTEQQEVIIRDLLERLHTSFEEEAKRNATSLTLVLDFQKTLVNISSTLLRNKHDRPTLFIIFKESDLKTYLDQAIEISCRNTESKIAKSSSNGRSSSSDDSIFSFASEIENGFKNGWTRAKNYASSLVKDRYRVFFVCGYTHQIAMSGREGLGYVFTDTKGWVKRYTPLLKLMFVMVKVGVRSMLPGIPFPGIPDLGLDELGINHLRKNFTELAMKSLDDKKQAAVKDIGDVVGGGGDIDSSSAAASYSAADSTISSAISSVEWENEGYDNEAYALAKEILADVKDPYVEHTGLEQVTPMSGPNQGKTRWVWKDSTVRDCYENDLIPSEKAFRAIEAAKKKRGGEGL